jgi:hypothetical protein
MEINFSRKCISSLREELTHQPTNEMKKNKKKTEPSNLVKVDRKISCFFFSVPLTCPQPDFRNKTKTRRKREEKREERREKKRRREERSELREEKREDRW